MNKTQKILGVSFVTVCLLMLVVAIWLFSAVSNYHKIDVSDSETQVIELMGEPEDVRFNIHGPGWWGPTPDIPNGKMPCCQILLDNSPATTAITNQEIREAFMIGDTSLVSNYGVVISLNWLIVVKKMSALEATMLVVTACKDMFNRGMINVVQNATEFYSPYPFNIPFKSPQLVMNKIDKNIKLSVEFVDNDKLRFLQRKGDK